jgi:hypothetical protein
MISGTVSHRVERAGSPLRPTAIMYGRAILAAVFVTLAALSPAHATAEHQYGKREYAIIEDGRAPNGTLSLASHGDGESGHDNFHIYLMSEPGHRKLATLDNIGDENILDTAPGAYHAAWAPDSHFVAVTFRSERHIVTLNLYAIEGRDAHLIERPDLFRRVTGRTIVPKADSDLRTSVPAMEWHAPRRFLFREYRLFVMEDKELADQLGALGKLTRMDDGRYAIEFSAEADGELQRRNRFRLGEPKPGKFEN